MALFLIFCIPCSLIAMFLAAMIAAGTKTKKGWWVAFLLATLILTPLFGGMFYLEQSANQTAWNDGRCSCGGAWEFVSASRYRNYENYYWECDTCKKIIKTTSLMR